jgi:hypothetical protein
MVRHMGRVQSISIIPVICIKCSEQFICDTEKNQGEAYKSLNFQLIIIDRCTHCGHPNRIEVPVSED